MRFNHRVKQCPTKLLSPTNIHQFCLKKTHIFAQKTQLSSRQIVVFSLHPKYFVTLVTSFNLKLDVWKLETNYNFDYLCHLSKVLQHLVFRKDHKRSERKIQENQIPYSGNTAIRKQYVIVKFNRVNQHVMANIHILEVCLYVSLLQKKIDQILVFIRAYARKFYSKAQDR